MTDRERDLIFKIPSSLVQIQKQVVTTESRVVSRPVLFVGDLYTTLLITFSSFVILCHKTPVRDVRLTGESIDEDDDRHTKVHLKNWRDTTKRVVLLPLFYSLSILVTLKMYFTTHTL